MWLRTIHTLWRVHRRRQARDEIGAFYRSNREQRHKLTQRLRQAKAYAREAGALWRAAKNFYVGDECDPDHCTNDHHDHGHDL